MSRMLDWQHRGMAAMLGFLLSCLPLTVSAADRTSRSTPAGPTDSAPAAAREAAPAAASHHLLFISVDITPAARHVLLAREAEAAGIALQQFEYPLRGGPLPANDALLQALPQADAVWIDTPHPTAEVRLHQLLDEALKRLRPGTPVLWIPAGEPATTDRDLRAYLQAGGPANTRSAFALLKAQLTGTPVGALEPPHLVPQRGLYLPGAPRLFNDVTDLRQWAAAQGRRGEPVALLLHRYHFVQGNTAWLDDWLRRFQARGLLAYAAFSSQLNDRHLSELLERDGQVQARVVVNHSLLPQGANLQPTFERWGIPVLQTQPYRQDSAAVWEASETGLAQSDIPFYLAQPEAAGLIDPVVVVAHGGPGKEPVLIDRQAQSVVDKTVRLITLQTRPAAEKRLVAFVYNYPPGGSNFGASFLNVPRSLARVSQGLKDAGYAVTPLPEADWISGLRPLLSAYYPGTDLQALLDQGQAEALPLDSYLRWFQALPAHVREPIVARWGEPAQSRYVVRHRGQLVFVIPRLQQGALSVLPQPPREETLRQGQDPFMHRSKTPLSHHYLAVYLWARRADAVIHFGTHGTQEWAPGKLRGLDVMDPAWLPLGDVPVVYPYIVDNLGEGLTAKRRGRALLVSHRTPSFAPAGFNARMAHMHELMHEWETVDPGPTRQRLERDMLAQFVEHHLHQDLGWTADQISANFSGFLELLHPYLDRLAQSAQPKGLAVFGTVPDEAQLRGSLLQMLRVPLIEALGEDIDEAFLIDHEGVARARPARWLDVALKDADAASRLDLRPSACVAATGAAPSSAPSLGLPALAASAASASAPACSDGFVPNRAARKPIDQPALHALALRAQAMYERLSTEGEMPGLLRALNGQFLPAAYGGDLLRNPDSVPTGRNLTGLDPNRLPTRQAYEAAQALFKRWYDMQARQGSAPQRLALSLWAGETLRHQGVMESQALVALGAVPVWDASGRPTGIKLLSPAELGRPRVDVLLSITGSYRDQFPVLMKLLDQAVAAAASAEADNAIARNNRLIAQELGRAGLTPAQAQSLAQARIFGNAAGDYGTGIADAVQDNGLTQGAGQGQGQANPRLGQLFLASMSQPYVDGEPLSVPAGQAQQALGAHLRHTDAALMSRSSHLYAMVSSDDPFQYLGGLAAAARVAGRTQDLSLHVSQLQDAGDMQTETAAQAVAMEMQSRYLHPGWLKAQQAEGWAGALQVLKALQYSFGWQSVAPGTVRADHWQSFYEVLVKDKHHLGVPDWLRQNPQAYAQAVERLVQADRLGYWKPDADTRREMAQLYQQLTREAPLTNELAGVRRWASDQLQQSVAPTPNTATPTLPAKAAARAAKPTPPPPAPVVPTVRGMALQQVPKDAPPDRRRALANHLADGLAWVAMGLLMAAGAAWQSRRRPSQSLAAVAA